MLADNWELTEIYLMTVWQIKYVVSETFWNKPDPELILGALDQITCAMFKNLFLIYSKSK